MSLIVLGDRLRGELQGLAADTPQDRQRCRAEALIMLSEGKTVTEVAAALGVSRQTVYNWVERFARRRRRDVRSRLVDAPRSGRPRTVRGVIDPLIAAAIEHDPRTLGHDSPTWSETVLVRHLRQAHGIEVCRKSVTLALQRLRNPIRRGRQSQWGRRPGA